MKETKLEEAIYQKYILPTERPPQKHIGPEFEFPIVNLAKKPVNIPALQEIVREFAVQFSFINQNADDNGFLYSLTEPVSGDNLSFDCSYNTLELSFGKEENIHVLNGRFQAYLRFLQMHFRKAGHLLTGMGANPYHAYNVYEPIANPRYRMLKRHLDAYSIYGDRVYHQIPEFGMIAAASQVQIDVQKEQLIQTLNTYNLLEPFKAVLFANSYYDELPGLLISRDYFWKYSTQGYNPHNLHLFETQLHSIEEYIEYVKGQSLYCADKDGHYVHFKPIPLRDYIQLDSVTGEYFADGAWHEHTFQPAVEDLESHRTFKFEDLTYRGTIEFRSACEQPVRDTFCHTAFHAGLSVKLEELTELLDADTVLYQHGYNVTELRELLTHHKLPEFIDRQALSRQLLKILELAESGLKERGFDETVFLSPLYERAERLTNPARELVNGLAAGDSLEDWIEQYAALK